MSAVESILLNHIEFGERGREDYGDIEELAATIKEHGLIQPVTVTQIEEERYRLVTGGRRYRAHELLGRERIDCLIREVDSEVTLRELELIENVHRKELTWQERCEMELALHEVKGGTLQESADEADVPLTSFFRHLEMGKALRLVPKLKECKSLNEAQKFLKKTQEEMIASELAKRHEEEIEALATVDPTDANLVPQVSDGEIPAALTAAQEASLAQKGREEVILHRLAMADSCYVIGDCVEGMAQMEPGKFHFAEVDPPYAINLKDMKRTEHTATPLADYHEATPAEYDEWLYNAYSEVYVKLQEDAFAIFWYGMTHHRLTYGAIKSAGFTICDIPGIWVKPSGQTQQPDYNLANCYEPFFIARRGKPVINTPGRSNVFSYSPVPGAKKIHPTQRPTALIEEILTTFCLPGSRVLVPFLGSGASIRAAYKVGMTAAGWDLEKKYKNAFLMQVRDDVEESFANPSDSSDPQADDQETDAQ